MKNNLENKVVVITGGARGIGLEIGKELSNYGAISIIASSKEYEYYEAQKQLSLDLLDKYMLQYIKCDVRKDEDFVKLKEEILNKFSSVDILINNAGIAEFTPLKNMSVESFDNQNNILYRGTFLGIKTFLPEMLEKKSGLIANIISVAAVKTFANVAAYAGAKSAVMIMANSLREEVRKQGVKVMNFIPGATNTEIWDSSMSDEFGSRMMTDKEVAEVIAANINLCLNPNIMIEEVLLKPQGGDL